MEEISKVEVKEPQQTKNMLFASILSKIEILYKLNECNDLESKSNIKEKYKLNKEEIK